MGTRRPRRGASAAGLRIQVAHGTARATRRLRDDAVDLLIATPETALALQRRSALHADRVAAVLLAWPETWDDEEAVEPADAGSQGDPAAGRTTSTPERADGLVERYARRALTLGRRRRGGTPVGPVRTVGVPWSRRVAALGDLVELLDPASLVIWTADRGRTRRSPRPSALDEPEIRLVTGDAPAAATDRRLRSAHPQRLRQLLGAGEVVLLVPPGTESYVARIAAPRRPLRLPGLRRRRRRAHAGGQPGGHRQSASRPAAQTAPC